MTWSEALRRGVWSGSLASILSGIALAVCGKVERNAPAGPLNGPSQWVWGQRAAYRREATLQETALGYAIHHGVSIGWATVHEKHVASLTRDRSPFLNILGAGFTAATAFAVDYGVAKGRAQPGFDKQLSNTSLFLVYAAFALGLALADEGLRRR